MTETVTISYAATTASQRQRRKIAVQIQKKMGKNCKNMENLEEDQIKSLIGYSLQKNKIRQRWRHYDVTSYFEKNHFQKYSSPVYAAVWIVFASNTSQLSHFDPKKASFSFNTYTYFWWIMRKFYDIYWLLRNKVVEYKYTKCNKNNIIITFIYQQFFFNYQTDYYH